MMPCFGFCSVLPNYKSHFWTSGVGHQGQLGFVAVSAAGWIVQIIVPAFTLSFIGDILPKKTPWFKTKHPALAKLV